MDNERYRPKSSLAAKLVPHLFSNPDDEENGPSDFNGIELDLLENPVRIGTASRHACSFPAERDAMLRRSEWLRIIGSLSDDPAGGPAVSRRELRWR